MKSRRLFWVAVGAGLASVVFVIAQIWTLRVQDARFLRITYSHDSPDAEAVIAAVGVCTHRFTLLSPDHANIIVLPLKLLNKDDFICLTENLHGIKHETEISSHE